MKAGKGMSSDFMLEIGSGSLARLMSEWAHNKSWAETQSDEVESLRRQLDGLRRGLQQLIGAPDVPRLSDAELFTLLGEALDRAIDDRHVEYRARPDGPVELTVDVSALRVEPRSHVIPLGEPFGGLSPWLAPPQDKPEEITRCPEPVGASYCGARVTDGRCPEHGDLSRSSTELDGPATESMPPVEEPPQLPEGYEFGRVFTRDTADDIDWENVIMPSDLVTRLGDWWQFVNWPEGRPGLDAVYTCNALQVNHMLREVLHVHGTLWELCDAAERDSGQVSGE